MKIACVNQNNILILLSIIYEQVQKMITLTLTQYERIHPDYRAGQQSEQTLKIGRQLEINL